MRGACVAFGGPEAWLDSSVAVHGMPVAGGRLSWRWDGRVVQVVLCGTAEGEIRLGPAFPSNTPVTVRRQGRCGAAP